MRRLGFLFIVVLLIVAGILAANEVLEGQEQSGNTDTTSIDQVPEETRQPSVPEIGGWIPGWASAAGFSALKTADFSSVSPVWYEVNTDGTLYPKIPANAQALQEYTQDEGILLLPSIAMFDHTLFSQVAQEPALTRHIESILLEVERQDYDGIDIDYESIALKDKPAFFRLLQELSDGLHEQNKLLTVTVLSQWGEGVVYGYLPETRAVQDWSEIAKYADEVRIMTYDFTSQSAQFPGPIAPLAWTETVLTYALQKVPAEKLVLGVHTYAYEWYQTEPAQEELLAFEPNGLANPQGGASNVRAYTYETIESIHEKYPGGKLSEFEGEQIYRYEKDLGGGEKEQRVVVYINEEGIRQRYDLAARSGIKGIYFWRLGGESNLYSAI